MKCKFLGTDRYHKSNFFFFGWGFLIFEFVGIFNFLLRIVVLLPRNDIDICKVD